MKYPEPKAGQRVNPNMRGYKMACCDCGLVHKMNFIAIRVIRKNKNGTFVYKDLPTGKFRVIFKVWRDNRATGQVRRHNRIRVKTT